MSDKLRHVKVWAHRGQKGEWPENSMTAFRQAILNGCDGIESDVHLTKDNCVIILHDPKLDRTTTGKGLAKEHDLKDIAKMQLVKLDQAEAIPTFENLIDLLLEPENLHVEFNIDCKPTNDPISLFYRMHRVIASKPNWETLLAPRLILGLWHYNFIEPAQKLMPYAKLTHLGGSPAIARKHFWPHAVGFSLFYSALKSAEGQTFLKECQEAGKEVICWTANDPRQFRDCYLWNLNVVITDHTDKFVKFRTDLLSDSKLLSPTESWLFSQYLFLYHRLEAAKDEREQLAMIQEVNLLKHPPTPELSPTLSSISSDSGVITPFSLDSLAWEVSKSSPELFKSKGANTKLVIQS